MGSAMNSLPSSTSIISATETIGLVIEKMRKMASLGHRRAAGPQRAEIAPVGDLAAARDQHGDARYVVGIDFALHHRGQPIEAGGGKPGILRGGGDVCRRGCSFMLGPGVLSAAETKACLSPGRHAMPASAGAGAAVRAGRTATSHELDALARTSPGRSD